MRSDKNCAHVRVDDSVFELNEIFNSLSSTLIAVLIRTITNPNYLLATIEKNQYISSINVSEVNHVAEVSPNGFMAMLEVKHFAEAFPFNWKNSTE